MRKIIYALLLANSLLAAVVFLPKLLSGKDANKDIGTPQRQSTALSADIKLASDVSRAAKSRNLSQADLNIIKDSISRNQVKGGLINHLERGRFLNALLMASLFNNLVLNDTQKREMVQTMSKNLDFVKTVSSDSATLNAIPVEARRSGFTREKQQCLAILASIKAGKPSVPVALPYINDPDPDVRRIVGTILKDAGYHVAPAK